MLHAGKGEAIADHYQAEHRFTTTETLTEAFKKLEQLTSPFSY